MAAYLRQGGQVALILSEAEANALLATAEAGLLDDFERQRPTGSERKAADRAMQALAASTNRTARVAGYFPA